MEQEQKQEKDARVLYMKDGRERQHDLQHLFREGLFLVLVECGMCNEKEQEQGKEQELNLCCKLADLQRILHNFPLSPL